MNTKYEMLVGPAKAPAWAYYYSDIEGKPQTDAEAVHLAKEYVRIHNENKPLGMKDLEVMNVKRTKTKIKNIPI